MSGELVFERNSDSSDTFLKTIDLNEVMSMPDDKNKTGNPDRIRLNPNQPYEVNDLAKKFELPNELVKKIIEQEGPSRKNVEQYLQQMKNNRRR